MPMKLHTEQLGGHNGNLYIIKGGKVMKKSKPTEYKFYISLKQRSLPEHIIPFFPKFYGVHKHDGVSKYNLKLFNYDFSQLNFFRILRLCIVRRHSP